MKTITLTVSDDATITVDGVEYIPSLPVTTGKAEVKLWTPVEMEWYWSLEENGYISKHCWKSDTCDNLWLEAGNVRPTREHAEALDRKRRAESIIFRYFYERGIDTRWKEGETQWSIVDGDGNLVATSYMSICHGSPFYVKSKAIAKQAIADIPDAIRTALLGGWV